MQGSPNYSVNCMTMADGDFNVAQDLQNIPLCPVGLCNPSNGTHQESLVSYNLTFPTASSFPGVQRGNFSLIDGPSALATINTFLQRYVTPVIIVVGVLGNIASLAVFQTSRLRRQTSSLHLSALAISDTGFLLSLLISWLGWFRVPLVHRQPWCVLVVYLTYVCGFLSVWIVVTFTVERFIVACFPLQRKRVVRARHAKVVLTLLTVFALAAYSFATWMTGVMRIGDQNICLFYPKYQRVLSIIAHVDTAITFVIPMLTIITLNSVIAVAIYNARKGINRNMGNSQSNGYRTKLMYLEPSVSSHRESSSHMFCMSSSRKSRGRSSSRSRPNMVVSLGGSSGGRESAQRRHLRSTKMLLVVSTVFVVLNLPSHALKFRTVVLSMTRPGWTPSMPDRLWQHGAELVYYVNFAINFFLYSFCGQNFRRCLIASCVKVKARAAHLVRRKSKDELTSGPGVDVTSGPGLTTLAEKRALHGNLDVTTDWSSN